MDSSLQGLSSKEVEARVLQGEVNVDVNVKTRSIKQIFYENIVTLFNGINVLLAFLVFYTGAYWNMLFMLVIVINTVIGIIQEIRSKRTTDRLNIIAGSKATVIREGHRVEIPVDQIVKNDLILLGRGNQVPSDSIVISGSCDANESLLTGESKLVRKKVGSDLMSGSFVNSGTVTAEVIHVGAENYAAKISAEAKKHKKVNSEIMDSLNKIIKFVSIIIFPAGIILFLRKYLISAGEVNEIILSTVAALIGMIPEGLILLTSTVLAVSVIRLAQSKVLVQQLHCIETLARVDTLCLDKTGTITTGKMEVIKTESLAGATRPLIDSVFVSLVQADETPNETAQAIIDYYAQRKTSPWSSTIAVPFSSEKKWSGSTLSNGLSYVMGAGEFVIGERFRPLYEEYEELFSKARVLLLAEVDGFTEEGEIKGDHSQWALSPFMIKYEKLRKKPFGTLLSRESILR